MSQPARPPLQRILDDIRVERHRQDMKWGDQSAHPDGFMLAILLEEVGEAATAVIRADDPDPDLRHRYVEGLRTELVQVAAVAVQWIEHLDAAQERKNRSGIAAVQRRRLHNQQRATRR